MRHSVKVHFPVLLIILILVGLTLLAADTAYLRLDITSKHHNYLQVFWTGKDGVYTDEKTLTVRTTRGRKTYILPIRNALFAHAVRVDIQMGKNGNPPLPIELHDISYGFVGLFENLFFAHDLSSFRDVRGVVRKDGQPESDTLLFTHDDPKFEFDMRLSPIYHQILLPIALLLLLHLLVVKRVLPKQKLKFRVVVSGHTQKVIAYEGLAMMFGRKKIQISRVDEKDVKGHSTIQLDALAGSVDELTEILSAAKRKGAIGAYHFASYRSGEAL